MTPVMLTISALMHVLWSSDVEINLLAYDCRLLIISYLYYVYFMTNAFKQVEQYIQFINTQAVGELCTPVLFYQCRCELL